MLNFVSAFGHYSIKMKMACVCICNYIVLKYVKIYLKDNELASNYLIEMLKAYALS